MIRAENVQYDFLEDERRIVATLDGVEIAQCTYFPTEEETVWVLNHTHVEPEYMNQGIDAQLVDLLVLEARERSLKIKPICPFCIQHFQTHAHYQDIVAE